MAGEWITTTIGEQATLQRGVDITKAEQRHGTVPVISSGGVSSYHDTPAVTGPGVVLGRKGVVGSVYFVALPYWPHDTTLWVKDFHGNDPRFVYYFFRGMAPRIARMDVGSANPTLNRNHVHPIEISWPPLPEQRAIAHILGSLDDKIELNRRTNETLEAMARALFKSWFVDFDPVRAKAEGRDTGLPSHIAALFPDSFEDSELGEIPKGWQVQWLGELLLTVKGSSYKSTDLIESDTALVTLKSFARGGGYRPDGLKSFAGKYKPTQVVKPGELVLACTDVTQAAEVIGRIAMVHESSQYGTLVASLDAMVLRPIDGRVTRSYLYFLGGTDDFCEHMYAHTTGTTVLHLAKTAVPAFRFALPPETLVQAFDSTAAPVLARIRQNERESRTLAALRDALLPKLISGEIRVPADKMALEGNTT
jgi:type I restriction enzyme S subunit